MTENVDRVFTLWRATLKTAAEDDADQRNFCFADRKVVGVGWQIDCTGTVDWNTYSQLAEKKYSGYPGWWPAINALRYRMQINDLCWSRDWDGNYYLGRITSEWMYENRNINQKMDMVNIRECEWHKIGQPDAVPGTIINSFMRPRAIQQIDNISARLYSKYLFNKIANGYKYALEGNASCDILSLISSSDCEDLLALYLQNKGYRLIPSSCKMSNAAFEYALKHEDGHTAVAQVKQSAISMAPIDFKNLPGDRIYLFTTSGEYLGVNCSERINLIGRDELLQFIDNYHSSLSQNLQNWVGIHRLLKSLGH